jgi:hypothetical protein
MNASRQICPAKIDFFQRIWTLWQTGATKQRGFLPPTNAEMSVWLEYRRRIAGEEAARGGLLFASRNALIA